MEGSWNPPAIGGQRNGEAREDEDDARRGSGRAPPWSSESIAEPATEERRVELPFRCRFFGSWVCWWWW